MSTYKNLSHHNHSQKNDSLPLYRPLDEMVGESLKHKNILIGVVASILALTIGYVGFTSYQSNLREKSSLLLKENPKAVLEKYPDSNAATVARVKLGAEAMEKKQWDEALTYYQVLSEKKSIPSLVRIASRQNLALAYLNKGEKEMALQTLEKAALEPDNVHADYTRLLIAHVWEAKGNQAKADEIYKQLSEGAISNEIKEEAKSHLKPQDSAISQTVNETKTDTKTKAANKSDVKKVKKKSSK